jgi:hypothetical protein
MDKYMNPIDCFEVSLFIFIFIFFFIFFFFSSFLFFVLGF